MGTYNTIVGDVDCPRCGARVRVRAQCKLACTALMCDLAIGDEYPFPEDEPPTRQSLSADAYDECPECGMDFGLAIAVDQRRITSMRAEPRTLVHKHDGVLRAEVVCPHCGAAGSKEIKLYCGTMLAAYRLGDAYPAGARHVGGDGWIRGRACCADECERACFAVRVVLEGGVLRSVSVDAHQDDAAEGLS